MTHHFAKSGIVAACLAASLGWSWAAGAEGTWSEAAPMSAPRSELQAITAGSKIYVIGGNVVGVRNGEPATLPATGIAQLYDPAENSWQELPSVPFGATHNGIAELDGKIYIAGGFAARGHAEATDRFFVYDPATAKWQELPRLPSPRGAPAMIALDGKIYLIGGRNGPAAMPDHEVYDPATGKWSHLARLPVARDHVGIAAVNGKIHVYGGRLTDDTSNTGLHDVYDPATDSWTSAAPMPVPVSSGTFAQYRGLLIYLGGECKAGQHTFDEVQAYDTKTDRWRLLEPDSRRTARQCSSSRGRSSLHVRWRHRLRRKRNRRR